jgi:hypothetical protein
MSRKGTKQTEATKAKISLANTKHDIAILESQAIAYIENLKPDTLPTLSGLCLAIAIDHRNINDFRMQSPKLDKLCAYIENLQEEYLINNGLHNRVNPGFAQFLLKTKHNYKENPTQLTQNNYTNISPDVLAEALTIMGKK